MQMNGNGAAKTDGKAWWRETTGSALVVVMLLLAMIAVLTAVVARSISAASVELGAARNTILADSDLRAGVELAAAAILKFGDDMRIADVEVALTDRRIVVHITNECGRIDLNKAPSVVIQSMFRASGLDSAEATTLTTALVDWRGAARAHSLPPPPPGGNGIGAHLPGIVSADTSVAASSAATPHQIVGTRYFFHPAQLRSIPGFTPKIVRSILPVITVANGSAQIDPFVASPRVLAAMPEISELKVEGFVDARNGNTSRSTALLQLGLDKAYVTDKAAAGWRLEVTVVDRVGHRHTREVVIVMADDGRKPYQILYTNEAPRG